VTLAGWSPSQRYYLANLAGWKPMFPVFTQFFAFSQPLNQFAVGEK
jgi:hypothetical protein